LKITGLDQICMLDSERKPYKQDEQWWDRIEVNESKKRAQMRVLIVCLFVGRIG